MTQQYDRQNPGKESARPQQARKDQAPGHGSQNTQDKAASKNEPSRSQKPGDKR